MRLKLSVVGRDGATKDVVVTTDARATVSDVAATIRRTGDAAAGRPRQVEEDLTLIVAEPYTAGGTTLDAERLLVESPLGSGYSVAVVPAGGQGSGGAVQIAAVLRVLSGPDSGREYHLRAGLSEVGRDPGCDVVLSDSLVSKRHMRVDIGARIELTDLNSANGLIVDGGLVAKIVLAPDQVVLIGDTAVTVTLTAPYEARTEPSAAVVGGSVGFVRHPVLEPRYPGTVHPRPEVPSEYDKPMFPWITMLAPLIMAGALFAVTRNPLSLVFAVLSPIMLAGNYLTTRMNRRRRQGEVVRRFETQLAALEQLLAEAVPREREARLGEAPAVAELIRDAHGARARLWSRRPEHWPFLGIRLGTGTDLSRNRVAAGGERSDGLPEFSKKLEGLEERFRLIEGVPLLENLALAGGIGVAADAPVAADVARAYLAQLLLAHSPSELVVAAVVGPGSAADFEWLKWLPHSSSPQSPLAGAHLADSPTSAGALVSALEELVALRLGREAAAPPRPLGPLAPEESASVRASRIGMGSELSPAAEIASPAILLLVGADAPVDLARLVQIAERAVQAGIFPLWLAADPSGLPAACRTFVDCTRGTSAATVSFIRTGEQADGVVVERVSREEALRLALALAPVVDAGAYVADTSDLPGSIALLDLIGAEMARSANAVLGRWRENDSIHDRSGGALVERKPGKLRALVGQAGSASMHLDLRAHGPHALVGGTTGSGKSEFLRAWVLGMAAEYSPDRVTFLFVDYKGGSAFAACVALPHAVGLVTDLRPHLVRRALTSLRAELTYREQLLRDKDMKDLASLEESGDPDCPPSLVIVIDEFAALATDVPEFVDGVVDVAQRGRSLGIHLIMATQRPAGVIKDNLRANTNLRIALRMSDGANSIDVVDDPVAGGFDPSVPGRAVAKIGPGRLTSFQSAYASGWTDEAPVPASIEVAELRFGTEVAWPDWKKTDAPARASRDAKGPDDQKRLVATAAAAAESAGIPAPRRPWQDELEGSYALSGFHPRSDHELVLGLADAPKHQRMETVFFRPDLDGHLAVFGTGGTGKSVVLRTLAAAAARTPDGGPVWVYGLDFASGGLQMLEALPNVGSVIRGDDSERVARLFRMLKEMLEIRSATYAAAGAGSVTEYRSQTGTQSEPRVLLLVDGYPTFRTEYEGVGGRAQWYGIFQQLLTEGQKLGMHVALTADRPGSVPSSVLSSVQRRVVLRLSDDTMYTLLDVPTDVLGSGSPPGRAIVDGLETQIAIIGGTSSVAEQTAATKAWGVRLSRRGAAAVAPEIRSLPKEFLQSTLPASVDGVPVLGLSEETLRPVGFTPSGLFLLGGGVGSGRSNALHTLVTALRRWNPSLDLFYLGHRRSLLPASGRWEGTAIGVTEVATLARELSARLGTDEPPFAVVVESLSDYGYTPADAALMELFKTVKGSDSFALVESETATWGSSIAMNTEVKSSRRGFLLQPESHEGDLILKTAFPRANRSEFPPGRGYVAVGGVATRVQIPLADGVG
ncbi:FHA domain-containing protein [Microbacteriaceae bacterium VKM Ac-2855]|nr:FHA domain-containing protein [Microbacteriaceae bacterium VKM Ac-2855]